MYFVAVRVLHLMILRIGKTRECDQVRRISQDPGLLKQFGDGGSCETLPGFAGAGGKFPDSLVDSASTPVNALRSSRPKPKPSGNRKSKKAPIPVVFKEHRRSLVIALFSRFAEAGNYYLFTVFLLSYVATTLKLPASYGLVAVMIGSALNIAMIPVFRVISDRIGRKKTFFFGEGVIILSAWPIFAMIQTGQQWAIILGVAIFLALGHAAVYSVLPAFYCELFPTEVRYTGISVGYQTAAILLAGFTPVIASALVLWSGGAWPLVAIIIVTTIIAVSRFSGQGIQGS